MATVWLFINSTWTAGKHPAESPYGQPLSWGDNAFQTLAEAVSYAKSHSLTDVQFVDYDKSVLLTNANNFVKKISAKEIKGTKTEKTAGAATTYTEESKQSGAGKLAVDSFNQNAALGGFKEVVITDGTGKLTVTGGNNEVRHIYTSNVNSSFKDSGSVTGKADGALTLQGGNVTSAGGAWAEVRGPIADYTDITTTAEALEVADIGYAGDPWWSWPDSSVLVKLPGYATVTISEWGSAGTLAGGTLNYTHLTDGTYVDGSYTNVTKNYSQSVGAAGKLTVYTGTVDSAYRYATVDVTGGEFGKLYGGNAVNSAKTTYKETAGKNDSTTKITFEDVANYTAAGAFTANGLGALGAYKRDVDGYAKVTVTNTTLGKLGAANEKYTSKMTNEVVTPKGLGDDKTTISYSYTATYAAGGTLVTAKGNNSAKFGDISGFNKVELTSATVSGDIEVAGGVSGRPGSESTSDSTVSSGTKLMQSKYSYTSSFAAAGAVTLTDAVVAGMIAGAATVKLTDTTVSKSIIAGKYSDNYSSAFVLTPDKTYPWASVTTDTRAQKYTAAATGTLTMNGGKLVNAYKLEDFATVTLDKVGGSITAVYGFSSSLDNSNTEKYDWPDPHTSMQVFGESKCTETASAAGTFTATGKGGLVINYIYGANKATLTDLTVKYGIYAGTSKDVTNTRMTYDYKKMTATSGFTTTEDDNAAGTLLMKGGTLSGYISGYKDVTLDAVAGTAVIYIEGGNSSLESSGSSFTSGSFPVSASATSKTAETAAGALVMKNCNNMKISGISGFAKVEMTGPTVSSSITGGNYVEATSSRSSIDAKTGRLSEKFDWSSSSTLTGSAGLTDVLVNGSAVGFATVTLDSNSTVGDWAVGSDGGNVTSAEHDYTDYKGSTTLTGVLKSDYLDKYSDTAVGTLTLKNGAYVANAAGVKTATLTNATAVGSTIAMKTSSRSNSITVVSNAKTGLYESRQIDLSKGTAAGTAVIDTAMVGMDYGDLGSNCITGVAKLTANNAFLATVGGYNSDYCYSNCKIDTVFSSRTESYSSNAVGNFTLTDTTAGDLYGASTVKLANAACITGAYASNGKTSDSYSSAATKFSSAYNYSSWAAGNFTAGENSEIGSNGARGYQNVTMNDVTITGGGDVEGGKYVNTYQSSWTKDSATGPSRTFVSAASQAKQALGKATLTHVQGAEATYINGFATVVLDSATHAGWVNNFFSSYDSKYDLKLEYDQAGKLTKQIYSSGRSSFAKTELTLKNGASVEHSVNGVKTLNVAAGCTIGGSVGMRESKFAAIYNVTSNAKANLYEGKRKVESSYTDVGTVNVTGGQLSDIYGAAKVTATDAVLGDVTEYGSRYSSECTVQGPTIYSAGGMNYIDESKAVLLSSYLTSQTIAVGQATLTQTTANALYNIANVKLNDATVARAEAVNDVVTETYDYKNGKLDHKSTSVSDVTGTLTATDTTFTDTGATVAKYATVTLTDCKFTGNGRIVGGRGEIVSSGSVSGYTNYGDARAALTDDTTTTNTVAGKLTATRSTLGAVWSYAAVALTDCTTLTIDNYGDSGKSTLTLAGDNVINATTTYSIRNVTDVTVKGGSTTMNKAFSGGDADNTITVNAKAEIVAKGTVSFGDGNDTLTVNGAFRAAAGFDYNELEKLSGSGLLALTTVTCKNVLDAIKNGSIKKSGNLEIVAAGDYEKDVLAVRTRKEELADNTAKGARKHYSGTANGWLSAVEDPDLGKFADTEDWVSFKYEGGDYKVTLTDNTRYADLTVELYNGKGDTKISTATWNSSQKRFNLTGMAVGTDYQVHLAIKDGKRAMSYALTSPMG